MAVIHMKHKVNGTKVAIAEEEAAADEKRGWERFTPKEREIKDPAADRARMLREEEDSMLRWKQEQKEKALAR